VTEIFVWLESVFSGIPLGFLGTWGRFGYFAGFILAICAFSGMTLRPGDKWGLGWQRQRWDAKAVLSIPLTYILIFASGYIGSHWVLVPGAQTFESLKDLVVLLCIVLFGYPALLTVPFAYASSDLIEGVPPDFLLDWWTGYFINPACFWIAYQLFGKNPDFKRAGTWLRYLAFVLLFLAIEPVLWGYICSGKFTPEIAYRSITPALFFTTGITWIIGPFALLAALPLARRLGLFWAEIPGHVRERVFGGKDTVWESGAGAPRDDSEPSAQGVSLRLVILAPLLAMVIVLVGATAYVTLQESEDAATKLASRLHQEISENINLRLDDYLAGSRRTTDAFTADIDALLAQLPIAGHGRAIITDRTGRIIAASGDRRDPIVARTVERFLATLGDTARLDRPREFRVDHISAKPLARETWFAQAAPYQDRSGGYADWILVTAIPESFYLSGVRAGQSRSALVFAIALLVSMILAALLASTVMAPLRRIAHAIRSPAQGDLPPPLPASRLEELSALSQAFNDMTARLKESFHDLRVEAEARAARERALTESEGLLRRSEDRMQLAVKAARLGIWDWDVVTDELTWDDSMYVLFDIPSEEVVRTPADWLRRVLPEDVGQLNEEIQEGIRGNRVFSSDFRITWRDGSIRIIRGAAHTVRGVDGRALRMVGVVRDMTDLTMAERELRRHRDHLEELVHARTLALEKSYADLRALEALRDSMVHMVVHDLRSPLQALMFSLDMLIEDLEGQIGSDSRTRLEAALASVESLSRMANDMLDVSRIENDKMPLDYAACDLPALVRAAVRNLGGMARTRDVRLQLDEPVTCQCDGDLIRRVVENLVSNGIKHTPPDKPLWISVAIAAGAPRIEVRDEGRGIPQDARTKIFEKFGTLAPDGQREYHSAGLGLTFCKMVVEAHGGHIGVDSEPGRGSTFWFTLPDATPRRVPSTAPG